MRAYHWVWFIPALVSLAVTVDLVQLTGGRPASPAGSAAAPGWAAPFWIGPMWHVPREPVRDQIDLTAWQTLLGPSYFLAGSCYRVGTVPTPPTGTIDQQTNEPTTGTPAPSPRPSLKCRYRTRTPDRHYRVVL